MSSKRKGDSYLQRSARKTISWFLKRNLAGKKGLERSIQSHERQGPTSKITLSSKAMFWNGRADKVLPGYGQVKRLHHYQDLIIWNVKGIYLRKRRSKQDSKTTTNWQLSTTEPKTNKQKNPKNELSKQLEQEQIHTNRDHMEGYQ